MTSFLDNTVPVELPCGRHVGARQTRVAGGLALLILSTALIAFDTACSTDVGGTVNTHTHTQTHRHIDTFERRYE